MRGGEFADCRRLRVSGGDDGEKEKGRVKFSVFIGTISELAGGVSRFLPTVFSFVLACLFFPAAVSPLHADVQRPEDGKTRVARPPIAKPVTASVVRGEPSGIMLDGLTSTTKALEFIIRKQPRLGRLEGKPVSQGQMKAAVRYVADPAMKGAVDTFTYAVKYEGSSSSEEAVVTINIVDPAPVLDFMANVEMGSILAGRVSEQKVELRNSGNATFRATVPLPAGWSWLNPAGGNFGLAPGATINATVNVKAAQAGPIDEKVQLMGSSVLRFMGQAVPPFQGYPSLLALAWNPAKLERSATLVLANNSDSPVTVRISGPPELTFPAETAVAAFEKKSLTILLSGKLDQPASGTLKLDIPGWSQTVSFQAAAAPAQVILTGAGTDGLVDFGTLDLAGLKAALKTITLRNNGGTAASLNWKEPKFFEITGLAKESQLLPGQEVTLSIRPRTDFSGALKDDWTLGVTGGDRELKLRAELDPEAMKQAMMSGVALTPIVPSESGPVIEVSGDERKELISMLWGGLVPKGPNTDISLPKITTVRLVEAEPTRLLFEWDAPGEGAWTYRVLSMRLSKIQGTPFPVKEWGMMDNVKVTQHGSGGRAEVTKLVPEARWLCRLVAIRSDGKETLPGEMLTFFTPPVAPARWPWILLGITLTGLLIYWLRRKWREDIKWQAS